ncbi:MAG TPA: ABC transporter substrate-binding protein [Gammaproteobacteria bacterium]|nr:ABC transporter substrate-binding protein [Gammaproteobacteria bacterium]
MRPWISAAAAAALLAAAPIGAFAQRAGSTSPAASAVPPARSAGLGDAAPGAPAEAAAAPADARTETPEAAIERLYRALVEAAGAGGVEERYRRLDPVVAATHDLPYIAELTIRRQWDSLTPDQRQRFVDAFQRLSVMTYASRFGALKPGMLEVTHGERAGDDRAQVEATLTTASGEVIPFEYLLHETDGGWKIINILADNVSDLALKRAEYREVLEKGGVEDLIRHVEQQADDAARGGEVKYRK